MSIKLRKCCITSANKTKTSSRILLKPFRQCVRTQALSTTRRRPTTVKNLVKSVCSCWTVERINTMATKALLISLGQSALRLMSITKLNKTKLRFWKVTFPFSKDFSQNNQKQNKWISLHDSSCSKTNWTFRTHSATGSDTSASCTNSHRCRSRKNCMLTRWWVTNPDSSGQASKESDSKTTFK